MSTDGETRPDYGGGSIVNLMRSIELALGGPGPESDGVRASPYPPLRGLPPSRLAGRVLLWVVDGLGYAYLTATRGALLAHLEGSMTSVFPSTTSSAITTFMTGLAPQAHAMVGWFMWLKELGAVTAALPFTSRVGAGRLDVDADATARVFAARPFTSRLSVPSHLLMPAGLTGTAYTLAHRGDAAIQGFSSLDELVTRLAALAREPGPGYVYAYWPQFDALSHRHGNASAQVARHFGELDAAFERLLAACRGSGATLIVTADHGFVDTASEDWVHLDDTPGLEGLLRIPLTGEPRVAYCHVEPGRAHDFEAGAAALLGDRGRVVPSARLVEEGWFGWGERASTLDARTGDFTIVMRGCGAVRDRLAGEPDAPPVIGVHGGVSSAEMLVPLVVAAL